MIVGVWYFIRPGDQAILIPQEGEVIVRGRFNTVSLSPPQVLKVGQGDEIEAGATSSALVVLLPDASAELGADTQVTLKRLSLSGDNPPAVELEVRRGDTWHEISSSEGVEIRYEVLTPSARVTLSPARHHITVSDDGSTRVEVWQGVAKVKAQNTEVDVWQGEYTSLSPGQAPAVPRPMVARYLFVSERGGNADIWLLDEEGEEFQLTDDPAEDLAPAWSPDGTRIAFESLRDGNGEIYVMNADGSEQVNLTQNPAPDHAPAWSPDGAWIAFESLRDGSKDIYIMKADGAEQIRLTSGFGLNLAPHWAADNQGIVFTRIEADTNLNGSIDPADMGSVFSLNEGDGTTQALRGKRMIFYQGIFPWGLDMVG